MIKNNQIYFRIIEKIRNYININKLNKRNINKKKYPEYILFLMYSQIRCLSLKKIKLILNQRKLRKIKLYFNP